MKAAIFLSLLRAAVTVSAVDLSINTDLILPTNDPTGTTDSWHCVTESLSQYIEMPTPTGALEDAILDYGEVLFNETCTVTGLAKLDCPRPKHARWCDFTTAAAPELLEEYSSYAGDAFSWWTARSSTVSELVTVCPYGWHDAMADNVGGAAWLDVGLAHAQCYAQGAQVTDDATASEPAATTGSGTVSDDPEETGADELGGVSGRPEVLEVWVVATVLAVASFTSA